MQVRLLFIVSHAQVNICSYYICSRPRMSIDLHCCQLRRPVSTDIISAVARLHTHSADLISLWLLQLYIVMKYFLFRFVNAATSFL